MKIKLLLVDDHTVVLKGLGFFLGMQPDFELVGEARDGEEALSKIAELQPDVVLMDLVMPGMSGIEATQRIKASFPDVKVLVLTSFADQDHVLPALQAGAVGYLLKDVEPDQLVEAIRGAYRGNVQLHPEITNWLVSRAGYPETEPGPDLIRPAGSAAALSAETLTAREKEVLALIACGMSNKEIASELDIAEKTVKTHVSSILGKLGLDDRTQAALYAVKNGLA